VVGQVSPGSPADEAGLEPGDRFVAVDGIVIDAVDDLVDAIVGSGSGAEVEVVVDRDGSELSFDVILGSPPA
jgi:S1-C subfamily serine protease